MHTFVYWHQPDHHSPAPRLGLFGLLPPQSKRLPPPAFSQCSPYLPHRSACARKIHPLKALRAPPVRLLTLALLASLGSW